MTYQELTIKVPDGFEPYMVIAKNEQQVCINQFDGEKTVDDATRVIAGIMQYIIMNCCDLHDYTPTQREQLEAHFMENVEKCYSAMTAEWKRMTAPPDDDNNLPE